jgi:hypothetical protein
VKRIIIIIALGLVAPAVAVASGVATGSTRAAILRSAGLVYPDRCLIARITTRDGGNWAGVSFNAAKQRSCKDSAFNGVDVVRRVGGRWHYVTSGSADIPCSRLGIPDAVSRDLHLPCAVTAPTGPLGARHLKNFLSPDRKVWCGMGSQTFCGAGLAGFRETFPISLATLSSNGKVTICFDAQPPPTGHAGDSCLENWDENARVLHVGQENYVDGVLCKSETNGITCTLTAGAGQGKGFFINSTSVKRVGP